MRAITREKLRGTPGLPGVPFDLRRGLRALAAAAALALLPAGGPAGAQWLGDSASEALTRAGIDHIYNLRFDSARAEFRQVIASHPDHPAGHFFLAAVEWWRIMADIENTAYDANFIGMLDGVIDVCDRRLEADEHDVAALFFKGGSLGFQGRLHGNRSDWIKAANSGRSALPIVQETYRLAPENEDVLFGIGIYNYYAAIIPEMYPFVKPLMLFFPEGDKAGGLEQLERAARRARYADTEASYFLLQILYNFEKKYPEARSIASDLHRRYPDNPLFHRYAGRTEAALGLWDEAGATFAGIIARVKSGRLGYGQVVEREGRYYLGLAGMQRGALDSALTELYRCDELSRTLDAEKSTGYMTLANLKIGMIYDLQGKRDLALRQYDKVLDMKDHQSAHDLARRYKQSPYRTS
jgi:tetratricopeptide (TPR) repeat protein